MKSSCAIWVLLLALLENRARHEITIICSYGTSLWHPPVTGQRKGSSYRLCTYLAPCGRDGGDAERNRASRSSGNLLVLIAPLARPGRFPLCPTQTVASAPLGAAKRALRPLQRETLNRNLDLA